MSGEAQPRILGPVACYADLHELMRRRADELEITRASLDRLACLPAGYAAKLLSPKPMKKLSDETLGFAMPALGMKLVAIEDLEAIATLRAKVDRRKSVTMLGAAVHIVVSRRELKRRSRKGGANSRKGMSTHKAAQLGRKAARIRWADVKKAARVPDTSAAAGQPIGSPPGRPMRTGATSAATRPEAAPPRKASARAGAKPR